MLTVNILILRSKELLGFHGCVTIVCSCVRGAYGTAGMERQGQWFVFFGIDIPAVQAIWGLSLKFGCLVESVLSKRSADSCPCKRRTDSSLPRKRRTDFSHPRKRRTDSSLPRKRRTDSSLPRKRRTDSSLPRKRRTDSSLPRKRRIDSITNAR